jgi:hypothetical protein
VRRQHLAEEAPRQFFVVDNYRPQRVPVHHSQSTAERPMRVLPPPLVR